MNYMYKVLKFSSDNRKQFIYVDIHVYVCVCKYIWMYINSEDKMTKSIIDLILLQDKESIQV
jgi:hypothetical protein